MKEQKQVIKTWERKNFGISPNHDGTKTISSILRDNNDSFSKKSDQKLQFLFESFLPANVIVCPVQESFDANKMRKSNSKEVNDSIIKGNE